MNRFREIAAVLADTDDEKLIERFLSSFLTPKELNELSLRWELVKMLDRGMTQRKIAERLGISLCKITRGSRELKKNPSYFKLMIDRFYELRSKRE
ncbi:MAG: helix-turn-helix domain-containing protein [Spirochaetes bacterium]|nr:helix-turn-helix domain-containing protein [Spirochaetota bacterium]